METHTRLLSMEHIMQKLRMGLWTVVAIPTALWLLSNTGVFQPLTFMALRGDMVQYTGVLAMTFMSIAMVLATRPRWPERWFGGLDKMYRLHKWLGIGALGLGITHWLWSQGPKWAIGWGLMARPDRGVRPVPDGVIEQALRSLRGAAEGVGEWAFYAAVLLIVLALVKRFPYRAVFKTHLVLAVVYLVFVFHAVVLLKFDDWLTPLGVFMAVSLALGTWSACLVLLRRVASDRKAKGTIRDLRYYEGVHVLEATIDVPEGWQGHEAGQFAFLTSDTSEGAHPFTIASAWSPDERRLTFLVKELGDHTNRLKDRLRIGQEVMVEGPYGRFTFDDDQPKQIWVGGGIGITPFVARMQHLARQNEKPWQGIDLFHTTTDLDETALARLRADAAAAGVRLHVLVDSRDGLLNADRIRAMVPNWREASIWFCGPAGFGQALQRDFRDSRSDTSPKFHQELFAMR